MNLKHISFSVLLIFIASIGLAQPLDYKPLKCNGTIPNDFLELSSAKVKRENDLASNKKLSKKERANQLEFTVSTNYGVDQIIMSGQTLYGDPLTSYVNKVADIILKDDPELRKQLRFYTLKSDVPNAFTTHQGIIFVTVGLMAQVESEAQLAFILCHEIIHFKEKHVYQSFKRAKAVLKNKRYKPTELEDMLKKLYNYSKANELEADKKGYELFMKTAYSKNQAVSTFDMLLYSYLPFEEMEWKPTYFEDSLYVFPDKLTLQNVKEISADEEANDEEHTHPNIEKRKSALLELVDSTNTENYLYLTEKGDFENFQHLARVEIAFIYLIHGAFEKAFYHAYILEKKYNDRAFANRIKAMSLYGIYKHRLAKDNFEFGNYENCEGESQRVYYLLNKLTDKDITVLASREIWNYYLENKSDDFIKKLAYESLSDVFKGARLSRSFFNENIGETSTYDPDKKDTKIEKIKKRKKKPKVLDTLNYSGNYISNAYIELYKNPEFKKAIAELSHVRESDAEEVETKPKKKMRGMYNFLSSDKRFDTLIMLNPTYAGPEGKHGKRNLIKEERKKIYMAGIYANMALKNGITLNMLNTLDKEALNTEYWNTYMILNQWLTERLNNDTTAMNLYFKEYISVLYSKYNTNYFGVSGFRYFGGSGFNLKNNGGEGLGSVGRPNMFYYMLIFDTKTSKLEFLEYQGFVSKMRPELMKGLVYNTFYQLKPKSKK